MGTYTFVNDHEDDKVDKSDNNQSLYYSRIKDDNESVEAIVNDDNKSEEVIQNMPLERKFTILSSVVKYG